MLPKKPTAFTQPLYDLARKGRNYKVPKGQTLQSSDHRILLNLLVSGYVKRYMIANDGSLGVQYIVGPNYFFPLTPIFETLLDQSIYSGPEVYYYQTITDTEIYSIEQQVIKEATNKDPMMYRAFLSEAGTRLQDNIQRLENLALKTSYKRLAHQLAYYTRLFGDPDPEGIRLHVPLTHQDFADSLSVTRETISSAMAELRKKGLIKTNKGIVVIDIEKLEEEAYI